MWECSECEFESELEPDAEEGETVTCEECGGEFEIVSVDPVELARVDYEMVGGDGGDDRDDWDDEEGD